MFYKNGGGGGGGGEWREVPGKCHGIFSCVELLSGQIKRYRPRSNCSSRSSLIRACTVSHSICMFCMHYCIVKLNWSIYRIISGIILGVPIFIPFFMLLFCREAMTMKYLLVQRPLVTPSPQLLTR